MGIDARLLIRYRGKKPSDEQIAKWGDALCRSIGADKFFISDGLPSPEYREASKQWHVAFEAHPLYADFKVHYDDYETRKPIHDQIFADIGPAPKQRRRAIELTNSDYSIEDFEEDDETEEGRIPKKYREPGKCYFQDGDPIFAKPGEWFLRVSLWSRYYGVGYERGDLLTICAVAEWCEQNIIRHPNNGEVLYGGDSSGILAEPFYDKERRKLRQHLYSSEGRAYFQYERRGTFPTPKPCGLCIGEGAFDQFGYGHNYIAVACGGCGKSFASHDNGVTWAEKEKGKF